MHHGEQELLSFWEGRHWDDNKAGGLTLSCAPRRDVRRWRTFVATRCTPESPERRACGRRRRRPSRPGERRPTRDKKGKPNVRARWVVKEYKTHARPRLYASTPPLEALNVEMLEVATGKRGRTVVALVDVHFYAPARRRVFVELPPEDYKPGDEHMCGLLRYSLYCTRDAAQNWEKDLESKLRDLKLTRGTGCPCVRQGSIRVNTSCQPCTGMTSLSVENCQLWNSSSS